MSILRKAGYVKIWFTSVVICPEVPVAVWPEMDLWNYALPKHLKKDLIQDSKQPKLAKQSHLIPDYCYIHFSNTEGRQRDIKKQNNQRI